MEDYPRTSDPINNSDIDINDSQKYLSNKKYYNSLFPYDVSQNEYQLNQDVSELEKNNSQYVIDNQLKSRTSYVPICSTLFHCLLYLLCVIIFLSILYVSVLLCAFCLFNPMLIIGFFFSVLLRECLLFISFTARLRKADRRTKLLLLLGLRMMSRKKRGQRKMEYWKRWMLD